MWRLPCLFLAFSIAGCSTVEIYKVTNDSDYRGGVRYYRPHPYLLVTANPQGKPQVEIISLPDLKQEYAIKPRVRLGTVELNLTLEKGWNLVSLGNKMDSKIPETIGAVAGLIRASAAPGVPLTPAAESVAEKIVGEKPPEKKAPPEHPELQPGLYRIVIEGEKVSLREVRKLP